MQYLVITFNGQESKKENIYIYTHIHIHMLYIYTYNRITLLYTWS